MNKKLVVKFRGVRGSYPTPGQGTVAIGGNTACVEVRIAACSHLFFGAGGDGNLVGCMYRRL